MELRTEEEERAWLEVRARQRFLAFVRLTFPGYRIGQLQRFLAREVEWFEREVSERRSPRLMLFLPPRSGKSEVVSRQFPPWVLGRHPDWQVMLCSYGAELAEELSGDARRIVMSDEYKGVFGAGAVLEPGETVELERNRKSVSHWKIEGHRGGLRAVGIGGAVTGRGADILIVDDPVKNRDDADSELERERKWKWYASTARTRLEPGGGILLLCTRWHHDDLPGRVLRMAEEEAGADQWRVLSLAALAREGDPLGRAVGEPLDAERFSRAELERIRATIGTREWTALYDQEPSPDEGSILLTGLLVREDDPHVFGQVYQFWDTAYGKKQENDRSACTTWRLERNGYRLLHACAGRWSLPELQAVARNLFAQFRPRAAVVEAMASGPSLIQSMLNWRLPTIAWKPDRDKVARAHAVTPLLEAGMVKIPTAAPWLEGFLDELRRFPAGDHDDYVDSFTMALAWMGVRGKEANNTARLIPYTVDPGGSGTRAVAAATSFGWPFA